MSSDEHEIKFKLDKKTEFDKKTEERPCKTYIITKTANRGSGRLLPTVLELPLNKSIDRTVSSTPTGMSLILHSVPPTPTPHPTAHPMKRSGSMKVSDLIHNPRQFAQFKRHVTHENAVENFDFNTKIDQLNLQQQEIETSLNKESLEKKFQAECATIYETHLDPNAKGQITLHHELFEKLNGEYLSFKKDGSGFKPTCLKLFLEAQEKILQDLSHGPALRMKQSQTFKKISEEDHVIRKINHTIGGYLHTHQADENATTCCCWLLCSADKIDRSKVYANLKELHESFEAFLSKSDSLGSEIIPIIDSRLQTHRKLMSDTQNITTSKDAVVIALRDAMTELKRIDETAVQLTPSLSAKIQSPRESQKPVR